MNRQQRRREARLSAATGATQEKNWIWPISIGMFVVVVVVVVVLIAAGVFGTSDDSKLSANVLDDLKADSHVVGDPSAPVSIIEFADYQCPFCARFWGTSYQRLLSDFVQSGLVSIYFHNMAFLGPESTLAASASECAADQGNWHDFHDILFAQQGPENQGYITPDLMTSFAEVADLDVAAFNQCVESGVHDEKVAQQTRNAADAGINATPTIFVNGNRISNPMDYDELQAAVRAALSPA